MTSETLYHAPKRHHVSKTRVHDYLYDSAYIVSGARDYARTAFKAAMASAQVSVQPLYQTMFSELPQRFPRMRVVYHPNCRLPKHIDRSYNVYVTRIVETKNLPQSQLSGSHRFMFNAVPKKVLSLNPTSPDFHPSTPLPMQNEPTRSKNRGTQSVFRETSAQTTPWQPDGKAAEGCAETPEVLYLSGLEWGPGMPYRTGDLPADFHTTEIINKMRHARTWTQVAEKGDFPRWMKKRSAIISDVETKDWIFREAEIDELQDIRLALMHKLQAEQRQQKATRIGVKLAKLWQAKKLEMEKKVDNIRRTRDRELRKLSFLHEGGGRLGLVQRMRAARGHGSVSLAARDPTSDLHAPVARHGFQARKRHADITYDPSLLMYEDHVKIAAPPAWLEQCGQDLTKTCSGHPLQRDPNVLCERESKWSEQFLQNLHTDLKKVRLGAAAELTAGPLHVLKPRRLTDTPRPATPQVEAVADEEEIYYQSALTLQRIIRGRAVQCLMYEGRTRAAELTEELKTTHGLQLEDKIRIAKEEVRARHHDAISTDAEQKEDAISALVDELCGGAVSAALDFLEKELRRLKEERRQHAFILIAVREKMMREAAEAGRRQTEEHRRREHDEMFKQVIGVTQETVDAYLQDIVKEGVELSAEADAVARARAQADGVDESLLQHDSMSTAEQNELVAELVHQFLLPEAHKMASRHRISALQQAKLDAARGKIFGLFDEAKVKPKYCAACGVALGESCRCSQCEAEHDMVPLETSARDDDRWKKIKGRREVVEKTPAERIPPYNDFRCMLNALLDEVVVESRRRLSEATEIRRYFSQRIREKLEIALDAEQIVIRAMELATGEYVPPENEVDRHYYMKRIYKDQLEISQAVHKAGCPKLLPSELRRQAEKLAAFDDPIAAITCHCKEDVKFEREVLVIEDTERPLLPSELRVLQDAYRCKCDATEVASSESSTEDWTMTEQEEEWRDA